MSSRPKRRSARLARRPALPPRSGSGLRPAVFLDRDGTLVEEVGYMNHLDRARLYPWAARAIRELNRAGLLVFVTTNQSGVGRGYFTEALVRQVHRKIARELVARQAHVDGFYFCPHHPQATVKAYRKNCRCRKPSIGMLEDAARRFRVDLESSYVVGDSYRDMQLGFNAGARTVMVLTGYGLGEYEHHRKRWVRKPDLIVENLWEGVKKILAGRPTSFENARSHPTKSL